MAIEISNSGPKLIYKNGTLRRDILKSSVREVTLLRGTILKIEISNDPLKNIYVDQSNVIEPLSVSPGDLRNQILAMLASEEIVLLTDLRTSFTSLDNKVFPQPTIQDYTTPNTTYYGFAPVGQSDTTQPTWAIQRVVSVDGVNTALWASGTNAFDKVWDDRAEYTYS